MKFFFKIILFLLVLVLYEDNAFSLSDYQIRETCQNNKRRSACIRNLKFKKSKLLQGKKIEIPVIPFKK